MTEREIFIGALQEEGPAGQQAYLDRACGTDTVLRRRVEGLLRDCERAAGFLSAPAIELAPTLDGLALERPGAVIGPYKLLEQIGEGGMGLVFMAEQTHPVRRKVALKVLKPGMDTRQVVARFEAERQALAIMDHPHIARVFDAGTTGGEPGCVSSGRPYFVMELVRGVPITEYCDQRRLTTRERLELFALVCQAVQHAHQKGIIHRDLKPSNVLITQHDTVAVPKVIDFGIAKATTGPLTERTLFTNFAQLLGTPLYMSPEQAEMSGLDVDTRSDVYSLGVMLYELLTGTTPFESETLRKVGLDEMRRLIREDEPPTPSRRLSTLSAQACSTVSERRGVDGRRLARMLCGDIDWIVMRALEKDRNRRYESASAFAADVQRYLKDEPVEACPPSAGYRLHKYVRRNRRPLMMVGIVAVALMAATAVSTWQAVVARDAQHQAEADRKQAEADRDRAKSAENQAKTEQARAQAAEGRAATEAAIASAVNAFLQQDLLGPADEFSQASDELGQKTALTIREALDSSAARIGDRFRGQPLVEAAIRTTIGNVYLRLQVYQHAVEHLEKALALRRATVGLDHPDTRGNARDLISTYSWLGRHSEAIALCQRIVEERTSKLGPDHADTLGWVNSLGLVYLKAGRWDKSVPLLEQLLEKQRLIHGPTSPQALDVMHSLAMQYMFMGRFRDSVELHEKVISSHTSTQEVSAWTFMTFAQACQRTGELDKADKALHEALARLPPGQASPQGGIARSNALGWLALNMHLNGRQQDAQSLIQQTLAFHRKWIPDSGRTYYWESVLGAILLAQNKYPEAERQILKGYQGMKAQENAHRRWFIELLEAGERVVRFYEVTGQPEKVREWREKIKRDRPDSTPDSAK
jgi:serine/threonine protein kinase/tetratricopeptide (TPR) repeat protein